jgi:AcrR family transcriptional regulator
MRLPAAERRSQLLLVALAVFGEHGYHGASMNQVAEAAGVTKPVLYQHFHSKRELYLELLNDVGTRLEEAITKATAEAGSPRAQVTAGFNSYFRFVIDERPSFRLLFGGATRLDEEFAATVRRVEATISDAIAELIRIEGLSATERRLLAHGIVGLAEGVSRHLIDYGADYDPDVLAAQVSDLAWTGLRGIHGR